MCAAPGPPEIHIHSPWPLALCWKISNTCPSFRTHCNFRVYEVECYFKCSLFEVKVHLKYQDTEFVSAGQELSILLKKQIGTTVQKPPSCFPSPPPPLHPPPPRVTLLIFYSIGCCLFSNYGIIYSACLLVSNFFCLTLCL